MEVGSTTRLFDPVSGFEYLINSFMAEVIYFLFLGC